MDSSALAFKEWATNEGLTLSGPIEQLKGARVGIDAEDYVCHILFTAHKEPLLPALGGLPLGLHKRVSEDLENFREAEITPIFVFNGLELACRDRSSIFRDSRKAEKLLNEAWSVYDKGEAGPAVDAFGRAVLYRSEHIIRNVLLYLHKQGVDTQTAPYSAAAQLAYLERENYVDAVAGSASCLLYGLDKVITTFDWDGTNSDGNQAFFWVPLTKCLSKLALTREQFVNMCLISGCSILPTLPDIDSDESTSKIPAARTFIARSGLDSNSLVHNIKDEAYRELFMKARFALKHPVIATADGKIEPVDHESGPNDVHSFIGQRLPDELLAYMTLGLVRTRVLDARTRLELLETQPLDGGDSESYRKLVQDKLRPLRAQALAMIFHHLHRYYQKLDFKLVCYYSEATETPLAVVDLADQTENATKAADGWHVQTQAMNSRPLSNPSQTPIAYAISVLTNDADAKQTVSAHPRDEKSRLRELDDLTANTVWRFLEHRGYINKDHTLSALGRALKASLDHAASVGLYEHAVTTGEIEEAIFMAFELLRLDLLSSKEMFPAHTYSGAPGKGSDKDKAHTLLVSRVACLAAFHHNEIGYTGPLSRNLLAYHQMATATRGALRDLVEMHACNMFMSNSVNRKLEKAEYKDLSANLPFLNEPNVGLGLVVKTHLEEVLQASERPLNHVGKWFVHATDTEGDLEKAWKLWDAINTGVQAADPKVVSAETKASFKSTDDWLAEKRDQVEHAGPNGTA